MASFNPHPPHPQPSLLLSNCPLFISFLWVLCPPSHVTPSCCSGCMDVVANLIEALELLAQADPFSSADRDSLIALQGGRASYDASLAAVVASFAQGGEWAAEGAQSAASWLSSVCHLPLAEARAQVRRGTALVSMPLVS